MKIIVFVVISTMAICFVQSSQLKCNSDKMICSPGQMYELNNCQSCSCASNGQGLGGCSYEICSYPPGQDPEKCKVGTSWKEGCNSCCCVKNIGTICTTEKC